MDGAQAKDGEVEELELTEFVNIIRDYTASRLVEDSLIDQADVQDVVGEFQAPSCPATQAFKVVATRITSEHKDVFESLCSKLNVNEDNLYGNIQEVAKELFLGKTNWGRIVAFVAFSGALSSYCHQKNLAHRIPEVTESAAIFMKENLAKWISSEGGWVSTLLVLKD